MALRIALFVTFVTLCWGTRPVEHERIHSGKLLELELDSSAQAHAATSFMQFNSSEDEVEGESPDDGECCCYFPMEDVFRSNSIPGLSVENCPSPRGCNWGEESDGTLKGNPMNKCNKQGFISPRDIYCKATSVKKCNSEKSNIPDKIPSAWKECYGYKADETSLKDCMTEGGLRET